MKKRIVSMALIVAMVVAMIPAVLVPASAAPYNGYANGYDAFFTSTSPTLDGVMDDVYYNSETVVVNHTHTAGVNFETYFVVTPSGLYVFANVADTTVDVDKEAASGHGSGDKAQLYMQVSNTANTTTSYDWGYFDCDYGHSASAQAKNGVYVQSASKVVSGGYTIEMFAPWTMWTILGGGISLNNTKVYVGFQANNYEHGSSSTNNGLVVDNPNTMSYWSGDSYGCSGTTAPAKYMIALNPTTTPYADPENASAQSYTSFITTEDITLDGKRDDVYLNARPITAGHIAVGTEGKDTGFNTYIIAKDTGIYVFASIYDDTLDKQEANDKGLRRQDGDKFQLYLQVGSKIWNRWGYIDFDYVDGGRNMVTPKVSNGFDNVNKSGAYVSDKIQQKAVFWDDNKGWDIEIFIPNSFCADMPYTKSSTATLKNLFMKVNVQVLNETCTAWDANGLATTRERYGLCYDVQGAQSSWSNNTAYVPVDFSISPYTLPGSGAITYGDSVTIDGVKDAVYGDDTVAFVLDRETDGFTANNGDAYGKAWVVVTKDRITAYAEFEDSTIAATPSDAFCMYVYFPLTGTQTYYGLGYARAGHIETTSRWSSNPLLHTEGDANTSIGESGVRKDLGNGKYAVEISMNLPSVERYMLSKGETLELGLALKHVDRDTSGTAHANRSCYESYWANASYNSVAYPSYKVSTKSTPESFTADPVLGSANISLGESLAINYYATLPLGAVNPSMKFTVGGKVTYALGTATENVNEYKFTLSEVAPQRIADEIDAELYIGGTATGVVKENYSLLQNLNSIKNASNTNLINALLHYCAATQVYTGYKTEALVNEGLAAPSYTNITNYDKSKGTDMPDFEITAAGVYHGNSNKLYVKFTADQIKGITATVNGESVEIEPYGDGYIIFSEGVGPRDFNEVYEFVITSAKTGSQTFTYSVNAYVAAKQSSENAKTAALVKALYAYGAAAEAYNG